MRSCAMRQVQEQLADRSGIARATISNAENGVGTQRRTTINAWALACGVAADWIRTGSEPVDRPEGPTGLGIISPGNRAEFPKHGVEGRQRVG